MRKIVELELLSPFMSGGARIADNFFESEQFIRGSVIRAAFANELLLQCPFADKPDSKGRYNYIEPKDEGCKSCENYKICESFSDMYFSFAYPKNSFPAPFTSKACKTCGTRHPLKDTVLESLNLECSECKSGLKRMENLKGFIKKTERADEGYYAQVTVPFVLTTHTAIDYNSHTSLDGKLYSVRAIEKGVHFTAEIDDLDSGLIKENKIIYAGKYSSAGYGKIKIVNITDSNEITSEGVCEKINSFQSRFNTDDKATILFTSDAILGFKFDADDDKCKTKDEYIKLWQEALFGENCSCIKVEKVFAETQLYKGYDTSKKWGEWRKGEPQLLILKGTSILVSIAKDSREQAVKTLTGLEQSGIGEKTKDGFGQISVCHEIHKLGVD